MTRQHVADDFAAIRARMEELQRERAQAVRGTAAEPADIAYRRPLSGIRTLIEEHGAAACRRARAIYEMIMLPVSTVIEPMNGQAKVATIECSTCAALLEVYPQDVPGEPALGWNALGDGHLCQAPPLRRSGMSSVRMACSYACSNTRAFTAGVVIVRANDRSRVASRVWCFRSSMTAGSALAKE